MCRTLGWSACLVVLVCGCLPLDLTDQRSTALVSNNPFGVQASPTTQAKANFAPASQEVSLRVDQVGREILAANPQIGLRPLFATIGAPQPELFHVDAKLVYVTEGLVKQCKTNAELAALLSFELGRMVAEREARTSPEVRNPERLPPIQLPTGNASQGLPTDQIALAELGKFEKANPRRPSALPRPDPYKLAGGYLEKTGYQRTDLDTVNPLLQAAEQNVAFERLLKGALPQAKWQP